MADEYKVDSKLLHTPVEYICGDAEAHEREHDGGVYDGEPGYPKRTAGGLPEKILDEIGEFGKEPAEG